MPGEPSYPTYNQPQQGIPALVPQQQYPAPYGQSQGGGTGGLVDRNKIINDAVQNSLNQTQQIRKMQQDKQSYDEAQKEKLFAARAPYGGAPAPWEKDDHTSFMDTVLHGLSSLGAGVKGIFGGAGQPAPQGGIPAPAPNAGSDAGPPAPAAPSLAQTDPNAGPPAPVVQPQMDGGVVSPPQGTAPQFMEPQPTVLAFATGGAIPAGPQSSFGVRDGGTPGIRGFENGGMIDPNAGPDAGPPSPVLHPAVAQAQLSDIIDKLHADMHAHALGDDDKPNNSRAVPDSPAPGTYPAGSRDATGSKLNPGDIDPTTISPTDRAVATPIVPAGSPNAGAPIPPPAPPAQGVPTPPQAQGAPATPPSSAGSPDPSVASSVAATQAVQNAPPDDPAKTGVQTTSPSAEGKPHSITPDTWNKWDDGIDKATYYAAIAGHDPGQVRQALEANRNAYIQGHVLRYLSSANVALQNGDQKGVEKALRNAYYYTPDGQDLTIQKGPNGQLMYQDPVNPIKLDANNVAHANMIPVDAAHLQLLGQAFLDPMQVNRTIMEIKSSQSIAALKAAQVQMSLDTGTGNKLRGEAAMNRAANQASRVNSQNYKDLSQGDQARARASWLNNHQTNTLKANKLDTGLLKGAQDAASAFEAAAQGQLTTTPDQGAVGQPQHTIRDPSKSSIPGATPADIIAGKALASDIFMGGNGAVTPARAAELATLAHTAKRASHPGPDGKPVADYQINSKTGDAHVWNKALKKWEAFRLPVTSANAAANGKIGPSDSDLDAVTQSMVAGSGGIPSGGGSSTDEDDQPNAPDMQPASVPEDG